MGFDNECILNIQSLAGEYFCPVCRLLVYPSEAQQSQCTHLYCKPCLTYVVSTTKACPYDGYLVTEADSKPLVETNKVLAETIGKIAVHCLYHRSGCPWQGPLSDCTSHCSGCAFGNSPVVCNRCGVQIVHRQVQEHAQSCPGVQPQGQQVEGSQEAGSTGGSSTSDQTRATTQIQATQPTTQPITGPGQDLNQQVGSISQPQVAPAAVPTPEQLYQQQYQQYYQQYPGYDPYQQYYQQYYPYQQQAGVQHQQPQLQAQVPQMSGHPQAQVYTQTQPQGQAVAQSQPQAISQPQPQAVTQPQPQVVAPPQAQAVPHPQPQAVPHLQPQSFGQPQSHPPMMTPAATQPPNQAQVNPQPQTHPALVSHSHVPMQNHQSLHGQPNHQPLPGSQAYQNQPHIQQPQMPHYQQQNTQMQYPPSQYTLQNQPPPHPHPVPQSQGQSQPQTQHHIQPHNQTHPQQPIKPMNPSLQSQMPQSSAHAVSGHQSYPQLQSQQQFGVPQHTLPVHPQSAPHPLQQPVQMQGQYTQQPLHPRPPQAHSTIIANQQQSVLYPSQSQVSSVPPTQVQSVHPHAPQPGLPGHHRPSLQPIQQPMTQQYVHQQQPFAGQQPGSVYNQTHQQAPFTQQQPVQGHQSVQQPPQPQNIAGRTVMPNHGMQSQSFQPSAKPIGTNQLSASQGEVFRNNQVPVSSEQQSMATTKSKQGDHMIETSLDAKKDTNDSANLKFGNDMKPLNDHIKPKTDSENRNGLVDASKDIPKSEQSSDAVIGYHASGNGDSVTKSMVKEDTQDRTERLMEHSVLVDKEIVDGSLQKATSLQEPDKQSGQSNKDKTLLQMQGTQEMHKLPVNDAPSNFQQRPNAPPMLQALPGPPYPMQAPGHHVNQFRPHGHGHVSHPGHPGQPVISSHGPEVLPSGIAGPTITAFGRGPGQYGPPQNNFEAPLVTSQGLYNQGYPTSSHSQIVPPNAFDSHGGMMARAPTNGPQAQMGQQRHSNPMEPEFFPERSGNINGKRPDSHHLGSMDRGPASMYSSAHGERFKSFADDRFPMEPGRRAIDRVEFEEDLKQFPRPTHLDGESVSKFGTYSSRPLDRGPHGFRMDGPPRPHDKGPHGRNFDIELKLDSMDGSSRFLAPYNDASERQLGLHEDGRLRPENSRSRKDFAGPVSGFGRRHMDGLGSPIRDYPGISSRGFGPLHGGLASNHLDLENVDDRDYRRFGLPNHLRRREFECPADFRMGEYRTGDLIGPDVLPAHLRRSENLDPRGLPGHMRLGEPNVFDPFPGRAQGELGGPGNLPHPRLGEPGFRSSFSLQGFPKDSGRYAGDVEPFENSRKRKPMSMGWCRICKFDCETVEGLDMHAQTREHQKMAIDMVKSIKNNAKKHKSTTNDRAALDDASKPRRTSFEGRGIKH